MSHISRRLAVGYIFSFLFDPLLWWINSLWGQTLHRECLERGAWLVPCCVSESYPYFCSLCFDVWESLLIPPSSKPNMLTLMAHAFSLSTQEAGAGPPLGVLSHPGLQNETISQRQTKPRKNRTTMTKVNKQNKTNHEIGMGPEMTPWKGCLPSTQ